MPKPKIPNMRKAYLAHKKRTERYVFLISQLYDKLTMEAAKIAAGVNPDPAKQFMWSDYPETKAAVDALQADYIAQMGAIITSGTSAEWRESNLVQDLVADKVLKTYTGSKEHDGKNKRYYQTNPGALKAFQQRRDKGMNLSKRVWNLSEQNKAELEMAITAAIEPGTSTMELAAQVKQYLNEPDMMFRRFRYKDEDGEWQRKWKQRVVDGDGKVHFIDADPKAYHPGRGVYRSSARNAQRMARTEINMAYRAAEQERWNQFDFVVGFEVKITQSGLHVEDMCDDLQGKYPKSFIFRGWHPQCYSDDSEVLTDNGWKLFKDVAADDLILSLNPKTRETEYVAITDRQCYERNGDMIHFYNRSLDCLVTPEHRMVYLNKSDGRIAYKNADEFRMQQGAFYRGADYATPDIPFMEIEGKVLNFDDYCEFMAYWLADGSLQHGTGVVISQREGEPAFDKILNLSRRMGYSPKISGDNIYIYNSALNRHLNQFGTCTKKFVPKAILNASKRQIRLFLDAFILCDGYKRKPKSFIGNRGTIFNSSKDENVYFTTSERLAGNLSELILKVGHRPSFQIQEPKTSIKKDGSIIKSNFKCYRISECYATTATVFKKEVIPYSGKVYDLTLAKNHIMYIRRNGKCFWGSNCLCYTIPILKTEEEFASLDDDAPSVNAVTAMPPNFDKWIKKNADRIEAAEKRGTLPYFIRDNKAVVDKILMPDRTIIKIGDKEWKLRDLINDCHIEATENGKIYVHPDHGKGELAENLRLARWRAEQFGEEVVLLPNPQGVKSADSFNVTRGVMEEYKRNYTPSVNSIDRLLRDGAKQADYIILEIDSDATPGMVADAMNDRLKRANIREIRLKIGNAEAVYSRDMVIGSGFKIKPGDFDTVSVSRSRGSALEKGVEPNIVANADAKLIKFFGLGKKSPHEIAAERHAKRDAAKIQQAWNERRIANLGKAVKAGFLPEECLTGLSALKQKDFNARIASLQKVAARHAKRSAADVADIQKAWDAKKTRDKHTRLMADNVLKLHSDYPHDVDFSGLEKIIADNNLTKMRAEAKKVAHAILDIKKDIKAASEYIPNAQEWYKKLGSNDLNFAKDTVYYRLKALESGDISLDKNTAIFKDNLLQEIKYYSKSTKDVDKAILEAYSSLLNKVEFKLEGDNLKAAYEALLGYNTKSSEFKGYMADAKAALDAGDLKAAKLHIGEAQWKKNYLERNRKEKTETKSSDGEKKQTTTPKITTANGINKSTPKVSEKISYKDIVASITDLGLKQKLEEALSLEKEGDNSAIKLLKSQLLRKVTKSCEHTLLSRAGDLIKESPTFKASYNKLIEALNGGDGIHAYWCLQRTKSKAATLTRWRLRKWKCIDNKFTYMGIREDYVIDKGCKLTTSKGEKITTKTLTQDLLHFKDQQGNSYYYTLGIAEDNVWYQAIKASKFIAKAPKFIQKNLSKGVIFTDSSHPLDEFYRKQYRNFPRGAMYSGDPITVHSDYKGRDKQFTFSICHEIGHHIDVKVGWRYDSKQQTVWRKAQKDDNKFYRDYGKNSPTEDFADSVSLYVNNGRDWFKRNFPHRAALLEEILSKL